MLFYTYMVGVIHFLKLWNKICWHYYLFVIRKRLRERAIAFRYSQLSPLALTVGHTPVQIYAHLSHRYLRNLLKSQYSHWTFVWPLMCHLRALPVYYTTTNVRPMYVVHLMLTVYTSLTSTRATNYPYWPEYCCFFSAPCPDFADCQPYIQMSSTPS